MFRSLIAALAAKLRGVLQPGWSPRARTLDQERKGHFFSWFHLDPAGDPAPASSGRTWHCFRPDGEAFRAFVELDVLIDRSGRILESRLGLDRAFADHPRNGVFARDLAKSYLQWGLTGPLGTQARTLIENIANPAAAGVPVLMRARVAARARRGHDRWLPGLSGAENHGRGHPREFKADDHEPAGILPGSADLRRRRPAAA